MPKYLLKVVVPVEELHDMLVQRGIVPVDSEVVVIEQTANSLAHNCFSVVLEHPSFPMSFYPDIPIDLTLERKSDE